MWKFCTCQKFEKIIVQLFIVNVLLIENCDGAKILFYNAVATPSHNMIMHPLAVELVDKGGHQVTYLAAVKLKNEHAKINYFYPEKLVEFMTEILTSVGTDNERETGTNNAYNKIIPLAAHSCKILMQSPDVHQWIERSTFDLLVINACYNECAFGLGHKFKAPHVIVQTAAFAPWHGEYYGIPSESSFIPDFRLNFTQDMNFFERLYNNFFSLEMYLFKLKGNFFPEIEGYLREGLKDPQMPSIETMSRDVKLMLVNSYFTSEYAHSLPPFVIQVGGLHIDEDKETGQLPNNIGDFIANFDGFIYISFGTMSKPTAELEVGLLQNVPNKFPNIGFVIKWAGKMPENPPKNVLPVLWAPQQVLLANPKIRGFVSHAGMLSVQEASHYGVPVIFIPSRADQNYNTECLVRLGVAIRLEIISISMDQLEEAVWKLLNDKSYTEKMKSLSQVYRDRPMKPKDTAIWWLEFVIRNLARGNDLSSMIPLGVHQTWYERRLLDVWAFIFVSLTVFFIVTIKVLLVLQQSICSKSRQVNNDVAVGGKGQRGKKVKFS